MTRENAAPMGLSVSPYLRAGRHSTDEMERWDGRKEVRRGKRKGAIRTKRQVQQGREGGGGGNKSREAEEEG